MINKLNLIDNRAKHLRDDRFDYMESRKFMVQKLKKDLEKMKIGLIHIDDIEKKYAFLHNDVEFQSMMKDVRREIHPGSIISIEQSLLSKSRKSKRPRLQDGIKSSIDVKPNGSPAPHFVKSVNISDKAKPADAKAHPDAVKRDQSPKSEKAQISEAEKARIRKQHIAEQQQKQVVSPDPRTKKFSTF